MTWEKSAKKTVRKSHSFFDLCEEVHFSLNAQDEQPSLPEDGSYAVRVVRTRACISTFRCSASPNATSRSRRRFAWSGRGKKTWRLEGKDIEVKKTYP